MSEQLDVYSASELYFGNFTYDTLHLDWTDTDDSLVDSFKGSYTRAHNLHNGKPYYVKYDEDDGDNVRYIYYSMSTMNWLSENGDRYVAGTKLAEGDDGAVGFVRLRFRHTQDDDTTLETAHPFNNNIHMWGGGWAYVVDPGYSTNEWALLVNDGGTNPYHTAVESSTITGSKNISGGKSVGDVLTFTNQSSDVWQSSTDQSTWTTISTGQTFTVTNELLNKYVRCIGSVGTHSITSMSLMVAPPLQAVFTTGNSYWDGVYTRRDDMDKVNGQYVWSQQKTNTTTLWVYYSTSWYGRPAYIMNYSFNLNFAYFYFRPSNVSKQYFKWRPIHRHAYAWKFSRWYPVSNFRISLDMSITTTVNGESATISGTAGPGLTVSIFDQDDDDMDTPIATATTTSDGAWTVTLTSLSDGTHNFKAFATHDDFDRTFEESFMDVVIETTPSSYQIVGTPNIGDAATISMINANDDLTRDSFIVTWQASFCGGDFVDLESNASHVVKDAQHKLRAQVTYVNQTGTARMIFTNEIEINSKVKTFVYNGKLINSEYWNPIKNDPEKIDFARSITISGQIDSDAYRGGSSINGKYIRTGPLTFAQEGGIHTLNYEVVPTRYTEIEQHRFKGSDRIITDQTVVYKNMWRVKWNLWLSFKEWYKAPFGTPFIENNITEKQQKLVFQIPSVTQKMWVVKREGKCVLVLPSLNSTKHKTPWMIPKSITTKNYNGAAVSRIRPLSAKDDPYVFK